MPCALPPVDQASSQLGWGWGNFSGSGRALALHRGLDFMADEGSPVLVPYAGTVVAVGRQDYGDAIRPGADGLGHYVAIAHGAVEAGQRPIATRYAHLRSASPLRVGQRVAAGDLVGYVGTSGRAPGSRPLLFFQTLWDRDGMDYVNAVPLEPLRYFFAPLGVQHEGGQVPGPPVTPYTSTPTWGGRLLQDSSCEAPGLASVADPRRQQARYARFGSTQLSSRAVYPPALYDAGTSPDSSSGVLVLGLAALAGGVWWLTRKAAPKPPPWWVRQQRWRRK